MHGQSCKSARWKRSTCATWTSKSLIHDPRAQVRACSLSLTFIRRACVALFLFDANKTPWQLKNRSASSIPTPCKIKMERFYFGDWLYRKRVSFFSFKFLKIGAIFFASTKFLRKIHAEYTGCQQFMLRQYLQFIELKFRTIKTPAIYVENCFDVPAGELVKAHKNISPYVRTYVRTLAEFILTKQANFHRELNFIRTKLLHIKSIIIGNPPIRNSCASKKETQLNTQFN